MSNAQKTSFLRSQNQFAERKVNDAIKQTGRSLPCTAVAVEGAIITVNFEVLPTYPLTLPRVRVPLFGPEYIRYPIQPGDKGVVFAADARLGAMSGLGGTTADLTAPANLGALVFFPIGNKTWSQVDPQSVTIYGPNGVVLYDTGKESTLTLTPSGIVMTGRDTISLKVGGTSVVLSPTSISMSAGGSTFVLDAAGIQILASLVDITGNLNVSGDITAP